MKVSVYDGGRDCFYEIEIDSMQKELESRLLPQEAVDVAVQEAQDQVTQAVADLMGVENATMEFQNGNIVVSGNVSVVEEPGPVEGE
jgi:hypothetical protein